MSSGRRQLARGQSLHPSDGHQATGEGSSAGAYCLFPLEPIILQTKLSCLSLLLFFHWSNSQQSLWEAIQAGGCSYRLLGGYLLLPSRPAVQAEMLES